MFNVMPVSDYELLFLVDEVHVVDLVVVIIDKLLVPTIFILLIS